MHETLKNTSIGGKPARKYYIDRIMSEMEYAAIRDDMTTLDRILSRISAGLCAGSIVCEYAQNLLEDERTSDKVVEWAGLFCDRLQDVREESARLSAAAAATPRVPYR